jgi:hypothetical protein
MELAMPNTRVRKPAAKSGNNARAKSFAHIDSERYRLPSSEVELTAEERRLLKDPSWIDEDEADIIICMRREKEPGNEPIPFREYLKRRGIKLDRSNKATRRT